VQQKNITVNGTAISQFDFINAMQSYSMELYRKTADQLSAEEIEQVQGLAVEQIVARELIFQSALAEGTIANDEQIKAEMQKVMANFPSEEEFFATLKKAGIDEDSYYRMLRQDLSVKMMTEKKLAGAPSPAAEEIKAFYDEHPDQMKKPGQVRASHILIKVTEDNREQAQQKIEALKNEVTGDAAQFGDLARQHSACPSKEKGGDLGFFGPGAMVKEFDQAAFSLAPGQISDIVETQFGFHLILVTERKDSESLEFEEVAPQIESFIKDQKGAILLQAWVEEMKEKAEIDIA
jgi:peptidyl-prolyl cis-trans isomerase C